MNYNGLLAKFDFLFKREGQKTRNELEIVA